MVKIFSTVRDTLRGSQRRGSTWRREEGEGDRGEQEKRGNQKGREQSSQ